MEDNGKQAGRDIGAGNHPSLPQIPVSICNPQDITREVLNFLPREQAEGLAKMAATELLRLQLREVESQKSCVEVEQKIDQAIRWATTLADQTPEEPTAISKPSTEDLQGYHEDFGAIEAGPARGSHCRPSRASSRPVRALLPRPVLGTMTIPPSWCSGNSET